MKICPKESCGREHNKPGKFCCRSCANSRVFSEEAIQKKIQGTKDWYKSLSTEQIAALKIKRNTPESKIKAAKTREEKYASMQWDDLPIAKKKDTVKTEQDGTCISCNLTEWLGNKLILEVDHIDGNTKNNSRANLRGLCPNCHSQTPTWRKGFKVKQPTDAEILVAYNKSSSMTEILSELGLKWGSFVVVIKSLERSGISVYGPGI